MFYKLVGKEFEPCEMDEWVQQFERNRKIKVSIVNDIMVSTVFLGLDHGITPGRPLLFETMTFDECGDLDQLRAYTWDQALDNHELLCKKYQENK